MKFLIDAQLPERLKSWIANQGHDVIHTNDLPEKHLTKDIEIVKRAVEENRIVVSKDSDFYKYYLVNGIPEKILMLTMGNLRNKELLELFELNFPTIIRYFEDGVQVVEFDNNSISAY